MILLQFFYCFSPIESFDEKFHSTNLQQFVSFYVNFFSLQIAGAIFGDSLSKCLGFSIAAAKYYGVSLFVSKKYYFFLAKNPTAHKLLFSQQHVLWCQLLLFSINFSQFSSWSFYNILLFVHQPMSD